MLCLLMQTPRELQLNLKTNNIQNCQKIKLYESPTTKNLKKPHLSRQVGGVETQRWDRVMWTPAGRVCVLWLQWTNSHRLQKSCGEKGMAWLLSKRERVREGQSPTPAWMGFYCFSGYITLRMVLIYYAQVHCR